MEANFPGFGFVYLVVTTLGASWDLTAVISAVVSATVLTMVHSEEELLYLTTACRQCLKIPYYSFWFGSYFFACSFCVETYVRVAALDADPEKTGAELYTDAATLAMWGWLASFTAWMAPMPFGVHGPVSLLIARLYQSREIISDLDSPPVPSAHPDWFADPDADELRQCARPRLRCPRPRPPQAKRDAACSRARGQI